MERLQLCFGAKSDAKPTQILPWVLCSVTQCQPNGPVSACSEADEGAVCQEKGPAGHSFCASSSPRQTEMQAVLLTLYPAQVWLPCLCCCRSQAVTPVKKAASKKSCWIFPNHGATWLIADFFSQGKQRSCKSGAQHSLTFEWWTDSCPFARAWKPITEGTFLDCFSK